jgi:hypothetical protein
VTCTAVATTTVSQSRKINFRQIINHARYCHFTFFHFRLMGIYSLRDLYASDVQERDDPVSQLPRRLRSVQFQ